MGNKIICINGGDNGEIDGNTLEWKPAVNMEKRAKALYSEDERQTIRQSHNNPQIIELYEKYLGEPNSHKAHKLLHTEYAGREGFN